MEEQKKQDELVDVMNRELGNVEGYIKDMRAGLSQCADLLRVEQTEATFNALSELIKGMSQLIDFIREIKSGFDHLKEKGIALSTEPITYWDKSTEIFKEMLSAFEAKDWITLADLIQYELNPLLEEGERQIVTLRGELQKL